MATANLPGFTADASLYATRGPYWTAGTSADVAAVLPQLRDHTDWTTADICRACGCSVSGFVCNCGLRPNPTKLECIRNGGPSKVVVFNAT